MGPNFAAPAGATPRKVFKTKEARVSHLFLFSQQPAAHHFRSAKLVRSLPNELTRTTTRRHPVTTTVFLLILVVGKTEVGFFVYHSYK